MAELLTGAVYWILLNAAELSRFQLNCVQAVSVGEVTLKE